ncbi:MAG: hypothetical protein R2874_13420 [Desulfobacterales bacterium]
MENDNIGRLPEPNTPISPYDVEVHGYAFDFHENWFEKGKQLIELIGLHDQNTATAGQGAGANLKGCGKMTLSNDLPLKGLTHENHGHPAFPAAGRMGQRRSNVRLLIKFLVLLAFFFVLFSVLFHVLMLHEGRRYSWVTVPH